MLPTKLQMLPTKLQMMNLKKRSRVQNYYDDLSDFFKCVLY